MIECLSSSMNQEVRSKTVQDSSPSPISLVHFDESIYLVLALKLLT